MKKSIKKFLVLSFVFASMFLFSNVAFAQDYILNVAFVGDSNLTNIVKKIFYNSCVSQSDGPYTWGIHALNEHDAFLYRFRNVTDISNIDEEIISDCDIVFIAVDFSNSTELVKRIDDYTGKVRGMVGEDVKIILIAKNIQDRQRYLNFLDSLKYMNNIDSDIVEKESFDFLVIDEDSNIRESFFEIEKKLGDLDRLQLKHPEGLPIDIYNSLSIRRVECKVNEHDDKLKQFDEELINIRNEFRNELNQLGNDSWKILEKVVTIFSREGCIDEKGCKEVLGQIKNISKEYGTFQDAYNAFKDGVNSQIYQFQDNIDAVGDMLTKYSKATSSAFEEMSRRQDAEGRILENSLKDMYSAIDETRNKLNEKISQSQEAIFKQEQHIREIEQKTTDQVDSVLSRVEGFAPIIKEIKVLQGQYEEFRDDINRKVSAMPDDIKKKVITALEIGKSNTSWFTRFWGKSELYEAIEYLKKK